MQIWEVVFSKSVLREVAEAGIQGFSCFLRKSLYFDIYKDFITQIGSVRICAQRKYRIFCSQQLDLPEFNMHVGPNLWGQMQGEF